MGPSGTPLISRYEERGILGRGGMGVVHAAHDKVRGHEVALKRLSLEKFDKPLSRRRATALFEREYHTLTQLAHPSVIAVYDFAIDDEGPYYTMERLHGFSLRDSSPVSVKEACSLIRDIASALALVHSRRLVHRDVTPLNIHCNPDGTAKLIDFGALAPMSVSKQIVGTAPYVAPECVRLLTLDGRTDLYSLGACLYYALTGRHAYPARDIQRLREVWQSAPTLPSRLAADVGPELDSLVMSMLHLDMAARPASAGEVIERLTAIAGLDRREDIAASKSYAVSPALVGRERPVRILRRKILKASRARRGAVVLIEGISGVGRSRLLDTAVLEAKVVGRRVARADATDGVAGPFGAVCRLLRTIADDTPELAANIAAIEKQLTSEATYGQRRDRIMQQVAELMLEASDEHGWVIVVDDAHLIDEPSLALIASLASQVANTHALVFLSVESDAGCVSVAALDLVKECARGLLLEPLDEEAGRALLASLFGEVPHLDTLNGIAQRSCGGIPRCLVNGAHALIDADLARYEGGNWIISGDQAAIESVLRSQNDITANLSRLSKDAIEVLAIVSLDRDGLMRLADYPALTSHGDSARINVALAELAQGRWVSLVEDQIRLIREADCETIVTLTDERTRREIHRRIAERLKETVHAIGMVYEAYHFAKSGLATHATEPIDRLANYALENPDSEALRRPIVLDALEEVMRFSEEDGIDDGFRAEHGPGLIINAMYSGRPERAVAVLPDALRRLEWFSGLSEYDALSHLDDGPRLFKMLEIAAERCGRFNRPNLNPVEVVRRLSQLSLITAVYSKFMADPCLLESVPDLTPFLPLSPAIGIAKRLTDAMASLTCGQDWKAWDAVRGVQEELRGPVGEQMETFTRAVLERAALGYLCAFEAENATSDALLNIEDYVSRVPHLAESHRARYFQALGDIRSAEETRRRFEVLSVQSNAFVDSRIIELPAYVKLYALTDDLLGLKRTIAALEKVVHSRPCWASTMALAKAHYLRCRGDVPRALRIVEASLRTLPKAHSDWSHMVALHVELLNRAGKHDAAVEKGTRYIETAAELEVPAVKIELAVASAYAELGEFTEAEELFARARSAVESRSIGGVFLGYCFEVGARIAQRSQDIREFERRARVCGVQYRAGRNALLITKHEALQRTQESVASSNVAEEFPSVHSMLTNELRSRFTVSSSTDLHAEVLSWLVAEAGADGGLLYLRREEGFCRAASTPGLSVPDDLDDVVSEFCASRAHMGARTVTLTAASDETVQINESLGLANGRTLVPVLLELGELRDNAVLGAAVMAIRSDRSTLIPPESAAFVARVLSERQEPGA